MEDLATFAEKRIEHCNKRAIACKKAHGENPAQTHTYHGGWSLGYWEGKLSTYEDMLDKISEIRNSE